MYVCMYVCMYVFLTVYATIGNQTFNRDRCNILPGLSYNKASTTLLNSAWGFEAQVEFLLKVAVERARVLQSSQE